MSVRGRAPASTLLAALAVTSLVGCSSASTDPSAVSSAISEVVTFGDSWSDAGTLGIVFGTAEGGAWPQLLAERYGVEQEPDRVVVDGEESDVGGLNYAEGGAYIAPIGGETGGVRPMTAQLEAFLDDHGSFEPDQLVTVWAGSNDIVALLDGDDPGRAERYSTGTLLPDELKQATEDIIGAAQADADLVRDILDAGATKVVVLDMFELGITAEGAGVEDGGADVLTSLSLTFDDALAEALPTSSEVALLDVAALFREIEADPGSVGFAVVDGEACTDGSFSCGPEAWAEPDADETYVFAGFGHFTRGTRELLADRVYELVETTWG